MPTNGFPASISTARSSRAHCIGLSLDLEFPTKGQLVIHICADSQLLSVLDAYRWAEPQGASLLVLESQFLRGTGDRGSVEFTVVRKDLEDQLVVEGQPAPLLRG